MRLLAVVLMAGLGAGFAHAEDPFGIYGYISAVVLEPNDQKPERMRVVGTFSTAVPGADGVYQAPEPGYLYFQLPENSPAALGEWLELKREAEAGFPHVNKVGKVIPGGIVAFGGRPARIRVRTWDEPPHAPDPYAPGTGVALMSYSADVPPLQMLGKLPKANCEFNYALVDKVVLEPNVGRPERIQIWGTFALGTGNVAYTPPQRGYMYLTLPAGVVDQWMAAAGSHQVFGFLTRSEVTIQIHKAEESPAAPQAATMASSDLLMTRPDTEYSPIRALLDLR